MTESERCGADLPAARVRASVRLPLSLADGSEAVALAHSFHGLIDGGEHLALAFAPARDTPMVRVHSECMTGDALGSLRCDCGPQLRESLRRLRLTGGYLLYLRQEGRGLGLYRKLDAYHLQEHGHDTFAANRALGRGADERAYAVAAQMLRALGVGRIELLSNNPDKRVQLERFGIEIAAMRTTGVHASHHNVNYLRAKAAQAGHAIALGSDAPD
ncbi:GTP cyclohydrolase II RibA [Lysobacter enzymogenes]|uniref:GTP cyclohydrolase II RibA n=1 Tax=Lysobacter enzymogenes TaxID=69 RepID=UPI000896AE50|nr:GTP cyclohydrolase II RibA [Lysobacter enzymogenes]SDW99308.1 GTP cyclohydrolase II [Lysobacter enzymogenes]